MAASSLRSATLLTTQRPRRQHPGMSDQIVKGPASYFPSIEKKYGRPIAEWKALLRARPPARHMELVAWLKQEHGMGHGHANALVAHTLAEDKG
jgi:hypothetical protein